MHKIAILTTRKTKAETRNGPQVGMQEKKRQENNEVLVD
jgi:hypothetical protein